LIDICKVWRKKAMPQVLLQRQASIMEEMDTKRSFFGREIAWYDCLGSC
jgi:hypothetical protein